MEQVSETIEISMIPSRTNPVLRASQYDTARKWLITLTDQDGKALVLSKADSVFLEATKPDNNGIRIPATINSDGTCYIKCTSQLTAVSGRFPMEIVVNNADGRIGSANVVLAVERGPLQNDTIISDTYGYATILEAANAAARVIDNEETLVQVAQNMLEHQKAAQQSAESAASSAQTAAGYAGAAAFSIGINPETGHNAVYYNG